MIEAQVNGIVDTGTIYKGETVTISAITDAINRITLDFHYGADEFATGTEYRLWGYDSPV